tara:strand:+ start:51 stop:683 length:633 start_codon:yes stop_codon:yes gene_type:complete
MNIDKLKPTTFLNINKRELPHCSDLSKPFFACIGCSNTAGVGVNYKDSWPNHLANLLNMGHINLGFSGSDLSYQSEKIDMVFDTLPQLEFAIWMQTFPIRNRKSLKLLGDTKRRIPVHTSWENPKTLNFLLKNIEKHINNERLLILNTWEYPYQYLKILNGKFKNVNNFFVNNNIVTDYGFDGLHSGPETQEKMAQDLYNYIIKHKMFGK